MSLREKNVWVYGAVAVLAYIGYLVVVLGRAGSVPLPEVDYVGPLLVSVGAAIGLGIVAGIVLGALSPGERKVKDEREQQIERLGERVGQSFVVIGAVGALVLALVEAEPFWIANVIYLGFVLSAGTSAAARLVAFRRGTGSW